jgi:hypothetical protein
MMTPDICEFTILSASRGRVLVDQLEGLGGMWSAQPTPIEGRARLIRINERGHANMAVAVATIAQGAALAGAGAGAARSLRSGQGPEILALRHEVPVLRQHNRGRT